MALNEIDFIMEQYCSKSASPNIGKSLIYKIF